MFSIKAKAPRKNMVCFSLFLASLLGGGMVQAFTNIQTRTASPFWQATQTAKSSASTSSPFGVRQPAVISRRNQSPIVVFMGWGPDPIWSPVKVATVRPACRSKDSVFVSVEVPASKAAEYSIPGQYVQMKLDDEKPLFLAISSPPPEIEATTEGEEKKEEEESCLFEFLVKKTDNNGWLTDLEVFDGKPVVSVDMSQVLGSGFPIEENLNGLKYDFPAQNILMFAAGSGIAPIRAAIESSKLETNSRTARLYYGVRTPEDLCFAEYFPKWESTYGVQVVPVISQPSSDWKGRTGYVQNALEEDGIPIPRNSGALLCGMKGMTESVKTLLLKSGVFEGRVMFNF